MCCHMLNLLGLNIAVILEFSALSTHILQKKVQKSLIIISAMANATFHMQHARV